MRADEYMRLLDACLEVPEPTRTEVLAEIESRVLEQTSGGAAQAGEPPLVDVRRLGSPRAVAARLSLTYRAPRPAGGPRQRARGIRSAFGPGTRRCVAAMSSLTLLLAVASVLHVLRAPHLSSAPVPLLVAATVILVVVVYRLLLRLFARLGWPEVRWTLLALQWCETGGLVVLAIAQDTGWHRVQIAGAQEIWNLATVIGLLNVWAQQMTGGRPKSRANPVGAKRLFVMTGCVIVVVLSVVPVHYLGTGTETVVQGSVAAALLLSAAAMLVMAGKASEHRLTRIRILASVPSLIVFAGLGDLLARDLIPGGVLVSLGLATWWPLEKLHKIRAGDSWCSWLDYLRGMGGGVSRG